MTQNHPIFLTGFMGAGKTTIGRLLAAELGCDFIDLDERIEARAGKPITTIFVEDGEAAFRRMESEVLASVPGDLKAVYATGGGIVAAAANRAFMRSRGQVIYLRARWETLQIRLSASTSRPLVNQAGHVDAIKKLLEERAFWYEDADVMIDTDDLSADAVVERILTVLNGEQ